MVVKSFVGGHKLCIFADCEFDPKIRKYRGGRIIAEIPFSGRILNAHWSQSEAEPVMVDGMEIPTLSPQAFSDVDELPGTEECDYCIVSALYVAACKALGRATDRLLTIGVPVVDEEGRTVGCCALNRN